MKFKYITWLPAAIIMVIIFCFSSKPADNSNESSLFVAGRVLTVYEHITGNNYEQPERNVIMNHINHYVRKGAHFSEYALLAIAAALHLLILKKKKRFLFIASVLFAALYAISDEYHQTFVAGRSGQVKDVLIDTAGAATGVLMLAVITLVFFMIKKANNNYSDEEKRFRSLS